MSDLDEEHLGEHVSRDLQRTCWPCALEVIDEPGLLATHAPAATRLAVAPPLFLAVGFLASWREGL